QKYDRALVPWSLLVGGEPTDSAVQEAMLAVPHAYASLNLHGRAAITYGRALELFSKQIEKVDASISSIREGRFLNALIREESLQAMTTAPRPGHLATADEQIAGESIALIEKRLGNSKSPAALALRERAARLRGVLTWRLETEYPERLTAAHAHLKELNTQVEALTRQYDAFVRTRLVAPALLAGCAAHHIAAQGTLADLRKVRPDLQEVTVEQGLDEAMQGYRRFLEETPETAMTPEAMRRLADLQIEKQFGIRAGEGKPRPIAAPLLAEGPAGVQADGFHPAAGGTDAGPRESDQD